jgi:hypothetical protein
MFEFSPCDDKMLHWRTNSKVISYCHLLLPFHHALQDLQQRRHSLVLTQIRRADPPKLAMLPVDPDALFHLTRCQLEQERVDRPLGIDRRIGDHQRLPTADEGQLMGRQTRLFS